MANMIFPYQLILHDLHRYELTQHWPFVTSVNMVTYFIHCVFVMKKNLSRSTSANRIFSNVSILTSHWPFVTSVNMVTYFIHCVFVMKNNLSRSTSANRIFSNVLILTSVDQQTIRSNLSTIRSLARGLLRFSSFFSMCIT
ncbi:hypothetical protein T03_4426, partial [Trichinella britovi]